MNITLFQRARDAVAEVEREKAKMTRREAELQEKLRELRGRPGSLADYQSMARDAFAGGRARVVEAVKHVLLTPGPYPPPDWKPRVGFSENMDIGRFSELVALQLEPNRRERGLGMLAAVGGLREIVDEVIAGTPGSYFGPAGSETAREVAKAEAELADVQRALAELRGEGEDE